jgi:hypothetical protein
VTDAAQLRRLLGRAFHLQQRQQLSVAVLLDDIDAAAGVDEIEDSRVNGYARSRRYDVPRPASLASWSRDSTIAQCVVP